MEATIQYFADSILSCSKEELFQLCLELKRQAVNAELCLKSLRESDTAMARDYQNAMEKIRKLQAEKEELQSSYNHVCERNELLLRQIYGSRNEKTTSMCAASGNPPSDPLSEEYIPEDCIDKKEGIPETAPGGKTGVGAEEGPDKKARKAAKKEITDALGKSRTKQGPPRMDRSRLPHTDIYELDIKALDERFGEGNWEIVNWHRKDCLHRPVISSYVETKHTPVVRERDTGSLVAMPAGDVFYRGSCATPSFIAHMIYEKVFKSVPLYRQSEDLQNMGLVIPRQDLSNWFVKFTEEYFSTPYFYMQRLQCERHYTQSDETPLLVLHEEGRAATTKSFVWVHTTGEFDDGKPIIIYCYEPTRGTDHLRKYYAGFTGSLTSDAYISYDVLCRESDGKIILCGCLMHARRRFADALKLISLDKLSAEQIDSLPAMRILRKFGEIYKQEQTLRTFPPEERLAVRQSEVKKLVEELYALIEAVDISSPLTSDKLKDAVSYSISHKAELCRFLGDGRIPCDNGFAERSVRILARGRRAWLFANTARGAEASMYAYSMVETAIMNKANPLLYLKYLLEKVPGYMDLPSDSARLEELMPWSDIYRRYEEQQMKEAMEKAMPKSQERPYYRPYLIKSAASECQTEKAAG
ncbi:MAG: IS66 family transposase [Solobacterium sp.]|nr:IS66 family transposase [Solobacterium sp.]